MDTSEEAIFIETFLPFTGVVFLIAIGVVLLYQQFQKSLFKEQLKNEELKNKHQQELLRTSIEVQEKERKRIAQDLHDELGATLSISQMRMLQLQELVPPEVSKLSTGMDDVFQLIQGAITSTQRMSHELMPAQLLSMGWIEAINEIINKAQLVGELVFEVDITEELENLSWPVKIGLYRVYAELINNTLKHAEASKVSIAITYKNAVIQCKYFDNGQGMDKSKKTSSGLGLKGIEARANALGGSFQYSNTEPYGFSAFIDIPYIVEEREAEVVNRK